MSRKTMLLLAIMTILAIPAFGVGTITAHVSLNGTSHEAFVGVKTSRNALADPNSGIGFTSGGAFTTGNLPDGTYYVAAWIDGYVAVETATPVTISGDNPTCIIDITQAVNQNLVQTTAVPSTPGRYFSGSACGDGSAPGYVNTSPAGGPTFVNGARAGATTNSGCWGTPSKTHIGVDLGDDHFVDQVYIMFWSGQTGSPYAHSYKIDYASGSTIPGLDSAEWHTWYDSSAAPFAAWNSVMGPAAEIITGTPTSARFWRIEMDATPIIAVQELELHSTEPYVPPALPSTIVGTVQVDGVGHDGAVIGIKSALRSDDPSAATADADHYYTTLGGGLYATDVLTPGEYYVGVYVSGKEMRAVLRTVSATNPVTADFNLTVAQAPNVAQGKPALGGSYDRAGAFFPAGDPGQPFGNGNGTFLDGVFDNGYSEAGDWCTTGGHPFLPVSLGVDLGGDCEVSQAFIDWYGGGYTPRAGGYKVEYATAADPSTWHEWYTYGGGIGNDVHPFSLSCFEAITGPPTVARYWRISSSNCWAWDWYGFLVQEFQVYSNTVPPPPPPSIAGTITVNGAAPPTTAMIGVKTSSNALADADVDYYFAAADGTYHTPVLRPGVYYVGVWVDGYKAVEIGPLTVVPDSTQPGSFDLTVMQSPNVAKGCMGLGGVYGSDGVFCDIITDQAVNGQADGYNHPGSGGALTNGVRNGSYVIAGDFRVGSGGGPLVPEAVLGVDLGADCEVSQVLIDWYHDGANYWPKGGYKVQYATNAAPNVWNDFYAYVGENPKARGGFTKIYEIISGAPASGRYWRISATDGHGWGAATFGATEFEVYSATPKPGIGYYKGLADGQPVVVFGKTVTLTPMSGGGPVGTYFYIEEPDRSSGIRVSNDSGKSQPVMGTSVSITGTIETDSVTRERYISAGTLSSGGAASVRPVGANTRIITADSKLAGMLVRTSGVIREIDPYDGSDYQWFKIADGYTSGGAEVWTKVGKAIDFGDPSLVDQIQVGNLVKITGVVSQEDAGTKVILLKSITFSGPELPTPPNPAHAWTCGFEPGEGFSLGNVSGQGGWSIVTSGGSPATTLTQAGGAATVVASPSPVMGTQSLRLWAQHTDSAANAALRDMICVAKATTEDDLNWMVIKFNIWRTPGMVDNMPATPDWPAAYTLGPGSNPAIQENYSVWFSKDAGPWANGGLQWDYSMQTYPLGASGAPTIAGRFVPVVLYMDFANSRAWSWYNDELVDNGIRFNPTTVKFSDFEFLYYCYFPALPGEFGRPAYLDNVSASWATTGD